MARMTAIIQQVAMVIKAFFRVDLGKKGFTIARYLGHTNANRKESLIAVSPSDTIIGRQRRPLFIYNKPDVYPFN
jgi:hypothetical protein